MALTDHKCTLCDEPAIVLTEVAFGRQVARVCSSCVRELGPASPEAVSIVRSRAPGDARRGKVGT